MQELIHGGDIYRNQVKLDFSVNNNPLGMPDSVRAALIQAVDDCSHYPDPLSSELIEKMASWKNIDAGDIICGNGASELFLAILRAANAKNVLVATPSFFGYERVALSVGAHLICHELLEKNNFALTESILDDITENIDAIILANPNNPTGLTIAFKLLEKIVAKAKEMGIILILDECFIEFTGKEDRISLLSKYKDYENLIVVRSFTKIFSIPGVRLGYLVTSNTKLLDEIRLLLPEWNLSIFAQKAGVAACGEDTFIRETVDFIEAEREWLSLKLKDLGLQVYPSEANYLLIRTESNIAKSLLEKEILIRDCSNFRGLKEGYFRIAIKNHQENLKLIEAMSSFAKLDAAPVKDMAEDANRNVIQDLTKDSAKDTSRDLVHEATDLVHNTATDTACTKEIEYVLPAEIEGRSFEIIQSELDRQGIILPKNEAMVTKRVIHTSADFSYASTLTFSENAVEIAKELIKNGADIVTDTNMALAGINKKVLSRFGGEAHCYMADSEVAAEAKVSKKTRASVSMEHAAKLKKPIIYAIGNAPTALLTLYDMIEKGYKPAFIIGVPVGFVNVEVAKEKILLTDVAHIVNRGRKGGSNVAASICNAILYELGRE